MSLYELIGEIGTNCDKCEVAYKEGRPEEMRAHLVNIKAEITEFLGDHNAVDEEPETKEETPQTTGHCQPDQTNETGS